MAFGVLVKKTNTKTRKEKSLRNIEMTEPAVELIYFGIKLLN